MLAASDFTTHGVIVGMTGSGKTGLGVVLLEEALLSGVPALIIDPKGDLTNLELTFPHLRPTDFRPWINEGDAQRAGATPDDVRGAGGVEVARRPRLVGCHARAHRRAQSRGRLHDLHAGLDVGRAAQPRRIPPGAGGRRRRDDRGRGRGLRLRTARPRRHSGRPVVESRAHPPVEHRRRVVERGPRPRPGDARRSGAATPDAQARCLRGRHLLSSRRTGPRSRCASTGCSRRPRSPRGRKACRSTSTGC